MLSRNLLLALRHVLQQGLGITELAVGGLVEWQALRELAWRGEPGCRHGGAAEKKNEDERGRRQRRKNELVCVVQGGNLDQPGNKQRLRANRSNRVLFTD